MSACIKNNRPSASIKNKKHSKTKKCSKCGIKKVLSEYYWRKDQNDYRKECKLCRNKVNEKWRKNNIEYVNAYHRKKRKENPEARREIERRWDKRHPEKRKEARKRWKKNNPDKVEKLRQEYNRRKKRATPPWITEKDFEELIKNCPKGHVLDHIQPLKHKLICGLNVPWNIQYLTYEENGRKGNRYKCTIGLEQDEHLMDLANASDCAKSS